MPTIVSWPGHVKPGRVANPVQITDWMPTFCSLVGHKPDQDLKWDGADISDLLHNQSPLPDRPIYTAGPCWQATSLRYGDWKLIARRSGEQSTFKLFTIAADPSEANDLSVRNMKQVLTMLVKLEKAAAP